jgi:hypothetical protein
MRALVKSIDKKKKSENENLRYNMIKERGVNNSTIGYTKEIFSPQNLHFPFNII